MDILEELEDHQRDDVVFLTQKTYDVYNRMELINNGKLLGVKVIIQNEIMEQTDESTKTDSA